jgi:hypothetical protein
MIDFLRAGAGRLINFRPRSVNKRNRGRTAGAAVIWLSTAAAKGRACATNHPRMKAVIERNSVWRVICAHRGYVMTEIKEHMEVIGADGVHVGTVDKIEGNRIKLTKKDSGEGSHKGHHHYIERGLVAGVEGNKVRLSATGAVAVTMEEEKN